jgi:hypothetical protein
LAEYLKMSGPSNFVANLAKVKETFANIFQKVKVVFLGKGDDSKPDLQDHQAGKGGEKQRRQRKQNSNKNEENSGRCGFCRRRCRD